MHSCTTCSPIRVTSDRVASRRSWSALNGLPMALARPASPSGTRCSAASRRRAPPSRQGDQLRIMLRAYHLCLLAVLIGALAFNLTFTRGRTASLLASLSASHGPLIVGGPGGFASIKEAVSAAAP